MQELLKRIAEVDEDEDLLVKVTETVWSGTSLQLRVEISVIDGLELGTWAIRCERTLKYMLGNEGSFSLDLVDNHPLLWEFKYPRGSAFFSGIPTDSNACVGVLYEVHAKAVDAWISFGSAFNKNSNISELLTTGNGLLAQGPVPLLSLYKEALLSHGVEVSIVNEHKPRFWDGSIWRALEGENVEALFLGVSYVIGIGWTAEQISR